MRDVALARNEKERERERGREIVLKSARNDPGSGKFNVSGYRMRRCAVHAANSQIHSAA